MSIQTCEEKLNEIKTQFADLIAAGVITVGPNPCPPEPAPGPITGLPNLEDAIVLFNSTGLWDNGHPRTMTGHHEFDPDDKHTEVAAGGHCTARKWFIDGMGNSFLSGGMSRVYNHSPHQGTVVILQKVTFNASLDNVSYEVFSRHNEGGAIENRWGGLQNHFSHKSCGAKAESYHKSYHTINKDAPYPDGHVIKDGDEVYIAMIGIKNGPKYKFTSLIDWDHNGTYTKVMDGDYIETENPKGTELQPLYWRFRTNGCPKDVKFRDTKFYQL